MSTATVTKSLRPHRSSRTEHSAHRVVCRRCGVGLFIFQPVNRVLAKFFGVFNRWFRARDERLRFAAPTHAPREHDRDARLRRNVVSDVRRPDQHSGRLIPSQDKGYLLLDLQLPDAASLERTSQTLRRIEKMALETKG